MAANGSTAGRKGLWLKLSAACLLTVAILAGEYAYRVRRAGRALAQQVADFRRAGDRVLPCDFVPAVPITDADNAALDLRAAAAAIDVQSKAWGDFSRVRSGLPLLDVERPRVRGAVEENRDALAHVDRAQRKSAFDWGLRIKSPVIHTLYPDLNPQRELSNLLRAAAVDAHDRGDDAEALRRIDQCLFLSRGVAQQPAVVAHLVALGIGAMAADTVGQVAPALRIGSGRGKQPGAPTREQVKRLIEDLLDERAAFSGEATGLRGDRMMTLDAALSIGGLGIGFDQPLGPPGKPPPRFERFGQYIGGRAQALEDARISLAYYTAVIDAAAASPDWPTFQRLAPPVPTEAAEGRGPFITSVLSSSATTRPVRTRCCALADARLAAVALAARWYALDHDDRLAQNLRDLVPAYLPALPRDPFTAGEPLRYDAARAIVYSVGEDGADDGGSDALRRPEYEEETAHRWMRKDAVMYLAHRPRAPYDPDAPLAWEGLPNAIFTGPSTQPGDP